MDETQARPELSREEQANLPSRKRQLDDDDDDAELRAKRARTTRPTSEPARLTRKNLALFNKMGKKKSSDPSDDSGSIKTISTTASGFAVQARENGILDPVGSKPPKNLDEVRQQLAASRKTVSPSESVYEDYVYAVRGADNEATMVGETLPLLKTYPREPYKKMLNQAFTAFPSKVGFNNGLSAPQPDFVEGLEMEEYRPLPIDKHVNGAVLYKDNPRSVTLPHIAGEWKGPGGDMREATLQSGYDGAALVYARNQALAYQGKSDPPDHANITTFTTNGTQVHFYAHYATPTEDGTLEYHQYPVKSTSLVNSHGEHKEGRRGLRNAQDRAKEQSHALKDQLKEHYKQQRGGGLYPVATGVPTLPVPGTEPPDAHEDENENDNENEDDYEIVKVQSVYQPTPPTSSKPKDSKSHHSHSTPHSSNTPSSIHSSAASSGHKRKAPSSQGSSSGSSHHSKYKSYWKKDARSGRYYHKHSDGTVSWLDDEEDEHAQ